jgi:hypothetical protein
MTRAVWKIGGGQVFLLERFYQFYRLFFYGSAGNKNSRLAFWLFLHMYRECKNKAGN